MIEKYSENTHIYTKFILYLVNILFDLIITSYTRHDNYVMTRVFIKLRCAIILIRCQI